MPVRRTGSSHNIYYRRPSPYSPLKRRRRRKGTTGIFSRLLSSQKGFGRLVVRIGVVVLVLGVLTTGITFAWLSRELPDTAGVLKRRVAQSTKIYDRTGEVILYDIHGEEKRTVIPLDRMPENIKQATIAIEDKRFYKHHGVNLLSIIQGVILDPIKGKRARGGSTLTQQFVKNAILSPERTVTRKIKEVMLALEMERRFGKEDILEFYLNEIPYGSNAYGIEAAAQTFFGKPANELELHEAALLASLPKAPTYFSPFGSHPEELIYRQGLVLDAMVEMEYITSEEAGVAKKRELVYSETRSGGGILAPHFVFYIREQLEEKYGQDFIEEGGLKVITTLDMDLQRLGEKAVQEIGKQNVSRYGANNAALTAVDPKTGEILVMVGSRDYFDRRNDGNVNVTIRDRQPGSSFKPYAYVTAFSKGYTPDTILFDAETNFGKDGSGKEYRPKNYDLTYRGPQKMREALARSLNIPAVKTLYLAGVPDTIETAHRMGITTLNEPDRYGLALVLGGGEVKLLDHVAAFSVFANDGVKHEKFAILRIENSSGEVLEEHKEDKGKRILDEQLARLMNSILSDNSARAAVFGSNSPLILPDRPVAAKTGTTQEFRDAWTIGFTPSLATGVWVGNNDNATMKGGAAGAVAAAPIWNKFMSEAMAGKPVEAFITPEPVETSKPVLKGETGQEEKVRIFIPNGKRAADNCPSHLVEEKTFLDAHSILYYVFRDDPQADYPDDPEKDPQFSNWEGGVQKWLEKEKSGASNEIPRETEDCTRFSGKEPPSVTITNPGNGDTVTANKVTVEADANPGDEDMKRVEFYIDGQKVVADASEPYKVNMDLKGKFNGNHKITARAVDKIDNISEQSITIKLNISGNEPPKVQAGLIAPANGATLSRGDFPYKMQAVATANKPITEIKFYHVPPNDNSLHLIGIANKEEGGKYRTTWPGYPGSGQFSVFVKVKVEGGTEGESDRFTITVQ